MIHVFHLLGISLLTFLSLSTFYIHSYSCDSYILSNHVSWCRGECRESSLGPCHSWDCRRGIVPEQSPGTTAILIPGIQNGIRIVHHCRDGGFPAYDPIPLHYTTRRSHCYYRSVVYDSLYECLLWSDIAIYITTFACRSRT